METAIFSEILVPSYDKTGSYDNTGCYLPKGFGALIEFITTLYTLPRFHSRLKITGARGGAVGSGTELQAGRSRGGFQMTSLDFFIDTILSAALWLWGRLSL